MNEYIPFGEEWEKEMMRLPKKAIIDILRSKAEPDLSKYISKKEHEKLLLEAKEEYWDLCNDVKRSDKTLQKLCQSHQEEIYRLRNIIADKEKNDTTIN